MPINDGQYCQYCVDSKGKLQTFDVRLSRMSQYYLESGEAKTKEDAIKAAKKRMKTMPAWMGHPKLK